MTRFVSLGFALAALALTPIPAATASPTEELRDFFAQTARILDPRSPDSAETRIGAIRAIVRDIVDVPGAARLALGRSWSARSQAELDEFVPLFAGLLEQSLIAGFAARISLANGVQIRYVDESVEDSRATVWTTILNRRGLELSFDYRMVERSGRWTIRDVVIDGVSVAGNYRAQFERVMQTSSYPELVRQLRLRAGASAPIVARACASCDGVTAPERGAPYVAPPADALDEAPSSELSTPPDPIGVSLETDVVLATTSEPGAEPGPGLGELPVVSPHDVAAAGEPIAAASTAPEHSTPGETRTSDAAYWVQVGAFRSADSARRLASVVSSQERTIASRSSVVVEPASKEVPLARVRIGPFSDRSEAAAKLRQVQARGFQPFIAEQRD